MEIQIEQAIEILERTPRTLRSLLQGISESWLDGNEGPATFSPRDVIGHLICGEEEDWIPRIQIILSYGESRPFDRFDRFGFRGKYDGQPIDRLLDRFEELRRESLEGLRNLHLQPNQLRSKGTHPDLGRVTLGQLIATWAVHDLGHIAQIVRVMAKQYRDEVGSWAEYISLLGR